VLSRLRVRGPDRVRPHADLTILATLVRPPARKRTACSIREKLAPQSIPFAV